MPTPPTPETRTIPTTFYRDVLVTVDRAAIAARAAEGGDADVIPIAISSEAPVERYDWWEGERYLEVLDHAASSIDLSYARDGLPFLLEHNSRDMHGLIENITVGEDRKLRGEVRFSKAARSQEIRQDMLDGIRKKISVGYGKSDDYTQTGGDNGATPTRRYTKWTPMEASSVSIPADYDVGVGRSATGNPAPAAAPTTPAPQARSITVSETNTAPGGAAPNVTDMRDYSAESVEINKMARANQIDPEKADAMIGRKLTVDAAGREMLALVAARNAAPPAPAAPSLDISPREQREFVLGRAAKAAVEGNWKDAGYEREVSDALKKQFGRDGGQMAFMVPTDPRVAGSRTSHIVGTANLGGNTVATNLSTDLIELLRNKSVLSGLGMRELTGLVGNLDIPRKTGAGTAAGHTESGSTATESNMTFDKVTLSPKEVKATQSYSRKLFLQSSLSIDSLIKDDISEDHALLWDFECLHGTGSTTGIVGLYSISGVNAVAMGGQITFAKVVAMEAALETANASLGSMAYLITPEVKATAKQTAIISNTAGIAIYTGSGSEGEINGYKALPTNQLLKNLGAGTNEHGIIFGAFSQAIVGSWGAMEFVVDPYTGAKDSKVFITSTEFKDFQVRHPQAFAKGTGLLP